MTRQHPDRRGWTILIHEFVTGGGLSGSPMPDSWAREGSAMRRALAVEFSTIPGISVRMTLDDRLADEPGPWELIRVGPGLERPTLDREASRADFTVCVAPETGALLADRIGWIRDAGGRSIGLDDPDLARRAGDKMATYYHWNNVGIRTPPTCLIEPGSGLPADYESGAWPPYPAVLKPRDGAGCLETRIIRSVRSARFWGRSEQPMVLQPWVSGVPMSAAYLCGPGSSGDRAWPIGLARQSIVRRAGRLGYDGGESMVGMRSIEADRGLESFQGVRGWIGIDFIRDPATGIDTLLELNPRVTTSFVGYQAALGVGWIGAQWLSILDDRPVAGLPVGRPSRSFDGTGLVREETLRHD